MRLVFIICAVLLLLPAEGISQSNPIEKIDFVELEPYLHQKSDTVYIVNFWATWCGPCREELPDLEQIHRDFFTEKVKVLLVSLDFPTAVNKSLVPFIQNNDITAEVVLLDDPDANAWIDKVDPSWSGALPATLVYSKDKRLFYGEAVNYQIIENVLSDLLIH